MRALYRSGIHAEGAKLGAYGVRRAFDASYCRQQEVRTVPSQQFGLECVPNATLTCTCGRWKTSERREERYHKTSVRREGRVQGSGVAPATVMSSVLEGRSVTILTSQDERAAHDVRLQSASPASTSSSETERRRSYDCECCRLTQDMERLTILEGGASRRGEAHVKRFSEMACGRSLGRIHRAVSGAGQARHPNVAGRWWGGGA